MLLLSGLPRADPPHLQDLSQEALDGLSADETQKLAPNSADRLSRKYRKFGPSMCVPAFNWQGFKGEAVLVFQHASTPHAHVHTYIGQAGGPRLYVLAPRPRMHIYIHT